MIRGLALALCLCLPAVAMAQQGASRPQVARPPAAPEAAPAPEPAPTAYEPDLLRLAEIIGSLAFLRQLCAAPDAAEWRVRMTDLMGAEGTTPGRRERLAGAYNRGFRGFALSYRTCTSAAQEVSRRLSQDGETVSRRLASRYGG
ncbi:MAG: TIGR02301 family protein [Hyphomicrobiales bacterium]|nr:TIGR02301 family protein [Hyphomicrobiales bacterium]